MIKLWPWRRAARSVTPAQPQTDGWPDDPDTLPYGPYSSVSVFDDAHPQDGIGSLVATRYFADPDQATQVHAAWQRHAPELTVQLRHNNSSSHEPDYEGAYLHPDGTWHSGQPAEIDSLVEEDIAAAAARKARQAQELAALEARLDARRPKTVAVAEAEAGDSPFAHHDKFLNATRTFVGARPVDQVQFHFAAFTGREPKPVSPIPGYISGTEQERAHQHLIRAEYDEATRLWTTAAYRLKAEWALRAAAEAWPKVAAAFARIEQAWADLDHPPHGWEVAVKQLLDAHDAAKRPVSDWEYSHARRLVTLGADLVAEETDLDVLRAQVGAELGIAEVKDWLIGRGEDVYGDGRYIDLKDGAGDHLDHLVSSQRARLAEITAAAGRATTS
jgi:hypothetical protein